MPPACGHGARGAGVVTSRSCAQTISVYCLREGVYHVLPFVLSSHVRFARPTPLLSCTRSHAEQLAFCPRAGALAPWPARRP
jgi:hypothetical protein